MQNWRVRKDIVNTGASDVLKFVYGIGADDEENDEEDEQIEKEDSIRSSDPQIEDQEMKTKTPTQTFSLQDIINSLMELDPPEEEEDDNVVYLEYEEDEVEDETKENLKEEKTEWLGGGLRNSGILKRGVEQDVIAKDCTICMEEIQKDKMVTLRGCEHQFCGDCLSDYCKIKSGDIATLLHKVSWLSPSKKNTYQLEIFKIYGIPCPAHQCSHVMALSELQTIADPESVDRFKRFSELDVTNRQRMDDLAKLTEQLLKAEKEKEKNCPRCYCKEKTKVKYGRVRCLKCRAVYCQGCGFSHARSLSCYAFKKMQEAVMMDNDMLLNKFKFQKCPWCFYWVQKVEGCNSMTCRCSRYFCYLCGAGLNEQNRNAHWIGNSYSEKCKGLKKKTTLITHSESMCLRKNSTQNFHS